MHQARPHMVILITKGSVMVINIRRKNVVCNQFLWLKMSFVIEMSFTTIFNCKQQFLVAKIDCK